MLYHLRRAAAAPKQVLILKNLMDVGFSVDSDFLCSGLQQLTLISRLLKISTQQKINNGMIDWFSIGPSCSINFSPRYNDVFFSKYLLNGQMVFWFFRFNENCFFSHKKLERDKIFAHPKQNKKKSVRNFSKFRSHAAAAAASEWSNFLTYCYF